MEKYTIDDLIIDETTQKVEKNKRKPKRKYVTIALVALILLAGVYLAKTVTGSSADINATEEAKIASVDTEKESEPKHEMQKVSDELSLAITELDSLEPPTAEPINNEIAASKTEELIEQKEETILPTEQEVQKFADELSSAATKSNIDEAPVVKTEELSETNQKTVVPEAEETQKTADGLSTATTEINNTEPSAAEPNIDEIIAARIKDLPGQEEEMTAPVKTEESIVHKEEIAEPAEQEAQKADDTPMPTVSETKKEDSAEQKKKPKDEVKKAEQPKQETKSSVTNIPDKKIEKSASAKDKKKDTANNKVKSEPKPKSKQDSLFNLNPNKGKYYILVGSNPSSRFLSKLKNAKLRYVIRMSNGKRSVFIGPYSSSNSARRSIGKVKKVTGVKGVVVKAK